MVGAAIKKFWHDQRGISLTETLLIMPIVILILAVMVEAGVAVFQWNQATKSMQIGARLAAVSSPVVGDTAYDSLQSDWVATDEGNAVPGTILSTTCGAGASPCVADRIARLLTGSDNLCDPTQVSRGDIVGMCDVAPYIGLDNVRVTYYRSGLGYVGRPGGAVTTVTVEIRNQPFDFLLLGNLIPAFAGLSIPAQPVSVTSEDLNDCRDTCP